MHACHKLLSRAFADCGFIDEMLTLGGDNDPACSGNVTKLVFGSISQHCPIIS
jgi:hypothetical protein